MYSPGLAASVYKLAHFLTLKVPLRKYNHNLYKLSTFSSLVMQEQESHLILNAGTEYIPSLLLDPNSSLGKLPDPHYYLRLSVLHNNASRSDCPIRMFVTSPCFLSIGSYMASYPFETILSSLISSLLFSGLQITRPTHSGDRCYR